MTCGTHDSIWFEVHGCPAVLIASSTFEKAATAQSEALGLPNFARVFVPHPIQDATDDEMRAKADAILQAALRGLVAQNS